jgi:hypothetical protein
VTTITHHCDWADGSVESSHIFRRHPDSLDFCIEVDYDDPCAYGGCLLQAAQLQLWTGISSHRRTNL